MGATEDSGRILIDHGVFEPTAAARLRLGAIVFVGNFRFAAHDPIAAVFSNRTRFATLPA